MAVKGRFRLLSAHFFPNDTWLPGDKELMDSKGEEAGTIVGDGTPYPVQWPTLEMLPLDEDAEEALGLERARLEKNAASMDPVNSLPMSMERFENDWVPGLNVRRAPAKKDGEAVK